MTWIKLADFKPPTHEIILFRDRCNNEHYGVLCGDLSKKAQRNKFWCHIFQKCYKQDDVVYWCEIPINKHLLRENSEFSGRVNLFLWEKFSEIESQILKEFEAHQKEFPEWPAENFVSIATRNCLHRLMQLVRMPVE